MNIYLTATLTSKPQFLDEVKTVLQNMVANSRKEAACIRYDLHQGMEDKNQFVFWEIWESPEALAEHNQRPYIEEFRDLIAEKLEADPVIWFMEKI